jgi:uncharacterized membrane protein YccC
MKRLATTWNWLAAAVRSRKVELRLCIRVTVAALSATALAQLLSVPQVLWAVLTAILLTQLSVGGSLKAAIDYFVGTLGGAFYSGALAALAPHPSNIAAFALLGVAIAPLALLAAINPSFRVAPVTAVMVQLAPAITHMGPIESAFYRVLEVGLGGITALLVSFLVLPARAYGLSIEAAARMLDQLAKAFPELLAGFTKTLDRPTIQAIQTELGQTFAQADAVAGEARRERIAQFAAEPDLAPLLRALLKLRHDLIMIGRAARAPLPEAFQTRLASPLARIGEDVAAFLSESSAALAARRAPPRIGKVEAAFARHQLAVAALRREGLTRDLSVEAVEHIFALGFALEQMRRNLSDLERCLSEFAQSPERSKS